MKLYLEAITCEDISLRAAISQCFKDLFSSFKRDFDIQKWILRRIMKINGNFMLKFLA